MSAFATTRKSLATVVKLLRDSLCGECDKDVAVINCEDCHESYCRTCCEEVHSRGRRQYHTNFIRIQVCGECEGVAAVKECKDCKEFYCAKCCEDVHSKGKRATHKGVIDMDTSLFKIVNYDTTNAFGINVHTLTVDRFRTDEGHLPKHLAVTETLAVVAQMCREGGKHYVDAEPCSLEIPKAVPQQQISTEIKSLEELEAREEELEREALLLDSKREALQSVLDMVYVWRRPKQVSTHPTLFSKGNTILDAGPLGEPLSDVAVKYLPKYQRGIFTDHHFLTAVSMVALNREAFSHLFTSCEHQDTGLYVFQFYSPVTKQWVCVSIDDLIPCTAEMTPVFGRMDDKNELWCIFLEKAYAKFIGSYSLLHSGDTALVAEHLTGGEAIIDEWDSSEWKEEEVVDAEAQYDTAETSDLEVNASIVWWKLVEGTKLGFVQAACNIPRTEHLRGVRSGRRRADAPDWNESAVTILQAIQLDTPGSDQYLVKMRNNFGQINWTGPWSDRSPLWTKDLRELAHNRHIDDYITWMSMDDFVKQFNTLVTTVNLKGGPTVFFQHLAATGEGMLPYYADQYLLTITDPADAQAHERAEATETKDVPIVDLLQIPEEIASDEEDDDEDEEEDTSKPKVTEGGAAADKPADKPVNEGASREQKEEQQPKFTLHLYCSQPDLGAVDIDGHFLCGAPAKPVEVQMFKVKGKELQVVTMMDLEPGAGTDTGEGLSEIDTYVFANNNKLELKFEKGETMFQTRASYAITPGHYVVAVHQGYHKDDLRYLLAVQGEDDYLNPLGYNVSAEHVGSCASPLIETKKTQVKGKPTMASRLDNIRKSLAPGS